MIPSATIHNRHLLSPNAERVLKIIFADMGKNKSKREFPSLMEFVQKPEQYPQVFRRAYQVHPEIGYEKANPEEWVKWVMRMSEQIRSAYERPQIKASYLDNSEIQAMMAQIEATPAEASVTQHQHQTNMDYTGQPVARPTLVYGEDVAGMNPQRIMQLIGSINRKSKELADLGITSAYIESELAKNGTAIEALVAALDGHADAAETAEATA